MSTHIFIVHESHNKPSLKFGSHRSGEAATIGRKVQFTPTGLDSLIILNTSSSEGD